MREIVQAAVARHGPLSAPTVYVFAPSSGDEPPSHAEFHPRLHTGEMWAEASDHWVHERAEKRVRDALMAGIGGAFGRPYFVEQEQSDDTGRFDIGFREFAGGGTSTLHAILELKAARSFGSGGAPESAAKVASNVVGGIEQSYAYAEEHGARDAACLVFDLRTQERQFEQFSERSP